jgi:hypothetical protein
MIADNGPGWSNRPLSLAELAAPLVWVLPIRWGGPPRSHLLSLGDKAEAQEMSSGPSAFVAFGSRRRSARLLRWARGPRRGRAWSSGDPTKHDSGRRSTKAFADDFEDRSRRPGVKYASALTRPREHAHRLRARSSRRVVADDIPGRPSWRRGQGRGRLEYGPSTRRGIRPSRWPRGFRRGRWRARSWANCSRENRAGRRGGNPALGCSTSGISCFEVGTRAAPRRERGWETDPRSSRGATPHTGPLSRTRERRSLRWTPRLGQAAAISRCGAARPAGSAPVRTRSCCSPPADPRHSRGQSCGTPRPHARPGTP